MQYLSPVARIDIVQGLHEVGASVRHFSHFILGKCQLSMVALHQVEEKDAYLLVFVARAKEGLKYGVCPGQQDRSVICRYFQRQASAVGVLRIVCVTRRGQEYLHCIGQQCESACKYDPPEPVIGVEI